MICVLTPVATVLGSIVLLDTALDFVASASTFFIESFIECGMFYSLVNNFEENE
jgi:hypothetical protein